MTLDKGWEKHTSQHVMYVGSIFLSDMRWKGKTSVLQEGRGYEYANMFKINKRKKISGTGRSKLQAVDRTCMAKWPCCSYKAQSTYICRVQSSVLRLPNYWPPTPSPPSECVLPPHQRRVVRGWVVNISGDARHWIGLLQYNPLRYIENIHCERYSCPQPGCHKPNSS